MRTPPPKTKSEASSLNNRRLQRFAAVAYGLLLAYVSLAPGTKLPAIPDWSTLFSPDKVAHFGAYAIFALLLSVLYSERGAKGILFAVFIAAAYGTLMEFLQAVAGTGRSFDPVDMVANLLGAILGGLLFFLFYYFKNKISAPAEINE
ncbi:VanZ family protein [Neolewinella agarilytica]|uniref:VanZ like family protein n=1 Tax=Neolewinella agarilytica TaxID=478744 RepID=A0A1H9B923_9BACT|nr:VanZ family protein [Neolewinella agarilytica]SEP85369.1 VanZ like family protein [Neolewinella agarilytica]